MAIKVFIFIFTVLYYVNCSTLPLCPANQIWGNCQSACPKTCATTDDTQSKPCDLSCRGGCGCEPGYVYETKKYEKCIKAEDCVKTTDAGGPTGGIKCPRTEMYSECNANCQKSCEGESDKCTKDCVPGCVCSNGFIRSKRVDGTCIADGTCPV